MRVTKPKEKGRSLENNTASESLHLSSYAENSANSNDTPTTAVSYAVVCWQLDATGHLFTLATHGRLDKQAYATDLFNQPNIAQQFSKADLLKIGFCAGQDVVRNHANRLQGWPYEQT